MRRIAILALVVSVFPLVPAQSEASGQAPLPEAGVIRFPGHGWGHGRGMGQWGAMGMAKSGTSYSDILHHYYSGVSLTKRAAENVRVLVETSSDVLVTSSEIFSARWSGGATITSSSTSAPFLRATQSGGTYKLQRGGTTSGPWTTVATGTAPIVFVPGTQMLQLVFGDGTVRYYRGNIEARAYLTASVKSINDLPLDSYLRGVVPREMPSSWPAEALKAQAVAARSYTLNKKIRARANGDSYDICATTSCQVYGGYGYKSSMTGALHVLEASGSNAAVDGTSGITMTVNGTPILSEYSSSTGGYSAPGSVSYLRAVPDPADSASPHHDWMAQVKVSDIEAHWPSIGRLVRLNVTSRNGYGDWGGRVLSLDIVGTLATVTVSGSTFASTFDWSERTDGFEGSWFGVQTWDAALAVVPGSPIVPAGQDLTVHVQLKNTGTTSWPMGGIVQMSDATSTLAGPEWITPTRPAAVSANVTSPGATSVRPGEIGMFAFTLHTKGLQPGRYSQRFSAIANGITVMNPTFTFAFTVVRPFVTPGYVVGNAWYLNSSYDQTPDIVFQFGTSGDIPIVGDWDGNGTETPGIVRGNTWYLNNGFDKSADVVFSFGRTGDIPIVGDWNGDGKDTIGVVRGNTFFLRNSNSAGAANVSFSYGRSTDRAIVGDWNADGTDTVGVVRGSTFYLRNSNSAGSANVVFSYGRSTDYVIAGDWNGDGKDTIGVVRGRDWYLNNSLDSHTDIHFAVGSGDGSIVVGNWLGTKP